MIWALSRSRQSENRSTPELHAVMHVEDENLGENVVGRNFRKGPQFEG